MRAGISFFIIALVMPLMSLMPESGQKSLSGGPRASSVSEQQSCTVTGLKASSVREDRAKLEYSVKGAGVTGFGVCWGTGRSPSLQSGNSLKSYEDEARDVPVEVSFSESLTNLESGTKYYARAYVTDSGGKVYYSEEVSFTTEKKENFSSLLNGPKIDYHPNGQVARRYTVKDGVPYGSYKAYSDSGKIVSDQTLVDGVPNGPTRVFYSNGNIRSVIQYVDGLPQGECKEYYENGNIKSESMISGEMDRLSAQVKQYYEEGGLRSETVTANGEFVSSITYDKEGRVTTEQKPGNIISYSYDNDGWKHTSINNEKCQCARCSR
jgi:antitoxin component YwqK of YwqJK toxin-antitoxin module